jgi:hypothetical protein
MKGCRKKKLVEFLSAPKEVWCVCFLQNQAHMEKSQSNKKRQKRRKS